MTSKALGIVVGLFFVAIGIYCIVNPRKGFDLNHPMKKVEPNEHGLKMTVVSGVLGVILGVVITVASILYV